MTDLGTLGGAYSSATSINDNGQIVGQSTTASDAGNPRAFLYSGGRMTDLGTLGGIYSSANAINNSGQIVGYSSITTSSIAHAFLYSSGGMTDLGTLGGIYSSANGINNSGQIVGESYTRGNRAAHGFLYNNGSITDLNDLIDPLTGWTISNAVAINNSGQIAAYSCNTTGGCRALLLSPASAAPEPEVYIMMLVGLGLLGVRMRRRISVRPSAFA